MKELIAREIRQLKEENESIINKLSNYNYKFTGRIGPMTCSGWDCACDLLDRHLMNCIKIDLLNNELKRLD